MLINKTNGKMATNYTTHEVKIGKTTWKVTIATGARNYVSVCKVTANPYGGVIGKDFPIMDDAIAHYKNPTMKVELLKVELNIN